MFDNQTDALPCEYWHPFIDQLGSHALKKGTPKLENKDCKTVWENLAPGETVKCSVCNQTILAEQDCVQSNDQTLCESCYRALIYPGRKLAAE